MPRGPQAVLETPLSAARVLVIDPSAENRLVLSESLRRSGVQVTATSSIAMACVELSRGTFRALVVDTDSCQTSELTTLGQAISRGEVGVTVVAGTNRPRWAAQEAITFVRKPYHYRELLHTIESVVVAGGFPIRAAA